MKGILRRQIQYKSRITSKTTREREGEVGYIILLHIGRGREGVRINLCCDNFNKYQVISCDYPYKVHYQRVRIITKARGNGKQGIGKEKESSTLFL